MKAFLDEKTFRRVGGSTTLKKIWIQMFEFLGRLTYEEADRLTTLFGGNRDMEVRLGAGPRRFWYHPVYLHTFSAVETQAQLRYRFDRRHSGLLLLDWSQRWYEGNARPPPPTADAQLGQRRDQLIGAGLGYAYRGPVFGQLTYSFEDHGSNSFGDCAIPMMAMSSSMTSNRGTTLRATPKEPGWQLTRKER